MIRQIRVRCTKHGAEARVFEDDNDAPTTYECVRDARHGWLVDTVISRDGRRIDRAPAQPPPKWAAVDIRRALDDACGPTNAGS